MVVKIGKKIATHTQAIPIISQLWKESLQKPVGKGCGARGVFQFGVLKQP